MKKIIMFIVLAMAITACGRGAPPPAEPNEMYNTIARPATTYDYADWFIQNLVQEFDRPHIEIAETRINRFEKIAKYDHPTSGTIELWAFNFSLRVEYELFVRWSGANAQPSPSGWVHQHALFGDMVSHLVFARRNGNLDFLGPIDWGTGIRVPTEETPWTTEILLIQFLEYKNLLLPVMFPGNHSFVYVRMQDDLYMRFMLSQPVTQGDGGIWAIERWQNFAHWGSNSVFFDHPQCDTSTIAEFYAQQQRRFDAGLEPYLGTPGAVVRAFLEDFISYEAIVGVYDVIGTNPTAQVNAHGPFPLAETEWTTTEWPTDFRGDFGPEYIEVRELKLAELGLAFNEAYHFRMDDGQFALISGWRPMLTGDEFARYCPGFRVPAQVGDFVLVGVTVQDFFLDTIRVYNRPVPSNLISFSNRFFSDFGELPFGEVFARNIWISTFYAVYVNNYGQYVMMGVSPSYGVDISTLMWGKSSTRTAVGRYGEFYFIGGRDRYAVVMHHNENVQQIITLGFLNPDFSPMESMQWLNDFRDTQVASKEELTQLIYAFNPQALFEEYSWPLTFD